MAVRTLRFEICRIQDANEKETKARWLKLSEKCQEFVNGIWREWLTWHTQHSSSAKIRAYLQALEEWRIQHEKDKTPKPKLPKELSKHAKEVRFYIAALKKEQEATLPDYVPAEAFEEYYKELQEWYKVNGIDEEGKPKLDVQALPKELQKHLYDRLMGSYPELNTRVRTLLLNITQKKIKERKAAKGSLSGWMAILLDKESVPSSIHPVPIPFDVQNCELVPPADQKENYKLRFRLDRNEAEGKRGVSTLDEVEMFTRKPKMYSQVKILQRLLTKEYKFCGSSLSFRDGKWYALICFDMPSSVSGVESNEVGILRAGRKRPWILKIGKSRLWRGGQGKHVEYVRKQLLSQRWSRQENYHHAGSSNKGHGKNRALQPVFKLSNRWKDFVKTANHTLTKQIVDECAIKGIGTIIYLQPADEKRDSRFLSRAGKIPNRRDSSSWDWHQVGSMLGYKCQQAGIRLIVSKIGEKKKNAKTQKAS